MKHFSRALQICRSSFISVCARGLTQRHLSKHLTVRALYLHHRLCPFWHWTPALHAIAFTLSRDGETKHNEAKRAKGDVAI